MELSVCDMFAVAFQRQDPSRISDKIEASSLRCFGKHGDFIMSYHHLKVTALKEGEFEFVVGKGWPLKIPKRKNNNYDLPQTLKTQPINHLFDPITQSEGYLGGTGNLFFTWKSWVGVRKSEGESPQIHKKTTPKKPCWFDLIWVFWSTSLFVNHGRTWRPQWYMFPVKHEPMLPCTSQFPSVNHRFFRLGELCNNMWLSWKEFTHVEILFVLLFYGWFFCFKEEREPTQFVNHPLSKRKRRGYFEKDRGLNSLHIFGAEVGNYSDCEGRKHGELCHLHCAEGFLPHPTTRICEKGGNLRFWGDALGQSPHPKKRQLP